MDQTVQGNGSLAKWKILNATNIKIIAIVLMFIDHVKQMYIGAPSWFRMFGRPVFFMFLFLAAESFCYTRSRKKYLTRLLYASWIMIIVNFIIRYFFPHNNPTAFLNNNAFSTFFIVGVYMQCWDWFTEGIKQKKFKIIFKSIIVFLIPIVLSIPSILVDMMYSKSSNIPNIVLQLLSLVSELIPNVETAEGGFSYIIVGLLFYIFRKKRILQVLVLLIFSLRGYLIHPSGIMWMTCFAVIPMILYNGQRGRNMKNFFYIFYPLHIWILYFTSLIFGK